MAERLFAEKGFDAVSLNAIAGAAGVSKANIFHHFGSKEGLYLAVLRLAFSRSARALDATLEAPPATAIEGLRDFFGRHLQALLEEPESARLLQRELMENGERRGRQLAEEVFSGSFSRLVELVQAAQEEGAVRREIDAPLLAFLLAGANIIFFEAREVLPHLPGAAFAGNPQRYGEAAFDLLMRGFQADE